MKNDTTQGGNMYKLLAQLAQDIQAQVLYGGKAKVPRISALLRRLAETLADSKIQSIASDTDLLASIIASLILNSDKEQLMGPDTENHQLHQQQQPTNIDYSNAYAIELVDNEGSMAIPRYLAFHDAAVLTNDVNHATLFDSYESATKMLQMTSFDVSNLVSNGYLTVSLVTYNQEVHTKYWNNVNDAHEKGMSRVKADTYTEPLLCVGDLLEEILDYAEQRKYNTALVLLEQAQRNLLDAYGRIAVKSAQTSTKT